MLLFLGVLFLASETLACGGGICEKWKGAWGKVKTSLSTPSKAPLSKKNSVKPTSVKPTAKTPATPNQASWMLAREQEYDAYTAGSRRPPSTTSDDSLSVDWLPNTKIKIRRKSNLVDINLHSLAHSTTLDGPNLWTTPVNEEPWTTAVNRERVRLDRANASQAAKDRLNPRTVVRVDRYDILESSIKIINAALPQDLAKGVEIHYGGFKKVVVDPNPDWYKIVAKQLSESKYLKQSGGVLTASSGEISKDAPAYRFFGRLLALHMIEGKDWYGTPIAESLLKYIRGLPVELEDVEDKELRAKFTQFLNSGDASSLAVIANGKTVELFERGSEIPVTRADREKYLSRTINYYFHTRREAGLKVVKKGYDSVINEWIKRQYPYFCAD